MIGVTSLTPSQACMADKASDLQGQSFVLCASNGVSSLFVGGQVRREEQVECILDSCLTAM